MEIEQQVKLPSSIDSLDNLLKAISNGARFVVFQYCVSPIVLSWRRFSPAILVLDDSELEEYKIKYNQISRFFGWWSIPYGPRNTLRSFRVNAKGGIDMTEDILLNLTDKVFTNSSVTLLKTNQWFIHPNDDVISAFNKTCKRFENNPEYVEFAIGLFINTQENERPYLVIGLRCRTNYEARALDVNKELYKHFSSSSIFKFVNLGGNSEEAKRLATQGFSFEFKRS